MGAKLPNVTPPQGCDTPPPFAIKQKKMFREQSCSSKNPFFVLNWGSTIPRQKAFPQMIIAVVPFSKMWIHGPQHQGTFWLPAQRSRLSRRDLDHKTCATCQIHRAQRAPCPLENRHLQSQETQISTGVLIIEGTWAQLQTTFAFRGAQSKENSAGGIQ